MKCYSNAGNWVDHTVEGFFVIVIVYTSGMIEMNCGLRTFLSMFKYVMLEQTR